MLKWVYGVLIAAFIAMVVGSAVSKAKDSWQAQQRAITTMQESQQKQRQKVDEIRDRIARTQAKPSLSDHDRWLIAHLQKTLDGLEKVVDGQQTHSTQLYRGLLRTWVGLSLIHI